MNFLPFDDYLIPSIVDGTKTSTIRFGLKYNHLKVGEKINIVNFNTNKIITQALITNKREYLFAEIPLSLPGHTSFSSVDQMRNHFGEIYNKNVQDEDIFLIMSFEIIK